MFSILNNSNFCKSAFCISFSSLSFYSAAFLAVSILCLSVFDRAKNSSSFTFDSIFSSTNVLITLFLSSFFYFSVLITVYYLDSSISLYRYNFLSSSAFFLASCSFSAIAASSSLLAWAFYILISSLVIPFLSYFCFFFSKVSATSAFSFSTFFFFSLMMCFLLLSQSQFSSYKMNLFCSKYVWNRSMQY